MIWTRRSVLRSMAACALPTLDARGFWSGDGVSMVREYKLAACRALSPDGARICLNEGDPVRRYGIGRTGAGERPPRTEANLALVRVGSWAVEHRAKLPENLVGASFFSDGMGLYGEVAVWHRRKLLQFVHDLGTGQRHQQESSASPWSILRCHASVDRRLVCVVDERIDGRWHKWWEEASATDWTRGKRIPYGPDGGTDDHNGQAVPAFSTDRSTFVHAYQRSVVCRRSSDFRVLWTVAPSPTHRPWRVGISGDGGLVSSAMFEEGRISGRPRKHFVAIIDGKRGTILQRIEADGTGAVAISGDGALVATAGSTQGEPEQPEIHATVRLFGAKTGKEVGFVTHSRTPVRDRLIADVNPDGIVFTPDRRYLITSGVDTRVWNIENLGL